MTFLDVAPVLITPDEQTVKVGLENRRRFRHRPKMRHLHRRSGSQLRKTGKELKRLRVCKRLLVLDGSAMHNVSNSQLDDFS